MYGITGLCVIAALFAACASKPAAPSAPAAKENNVEISAMKSTIRDWSNRTVGEDSIPSWLKPLLRGDSAAVRQAYGITNPTNRVKYSTAKRQNLDEAQVLAGNIFAQRIAFELKQYVVAATANRLDQGQQDIVEEITTVTKINITGNERVADFWHLVETEDPSSGMKIREYVCYVVWSMRDDIWQQLVRKYVNDIIGKIPDRAVQVQVANAFDEINAASQREDQMGEAEFKQRIDLQYQAAKDAQELKLAVNASSADVAKTQLEEASRARRAAYRSGNPDVAAAASTTADDIDWISALSTATQVLF
jgi:urease beta subunit